MSKIEELQQQISEVENELAQEGTSPQRREELSNMLSRPETGLRAQLKLHMEQAKVEEAAEQRIEESRQKVTMALEDVDGIPLEALTENESAATMIRLKVESIVESITQSANEEIARLNRELQESRRLNEQYQADNQGLLEQAEKDAGIIDKYAKELHDLKFELKDLDDKRQAAVDKAEELESKCQTLEGEIQRLKEGHAKSVEERKAEAEEARRRWEESRPKIYNVRWEDELKKTHYLAERAEDGETIRFGRLELGKYNVMQEEEAARFRAELEANRHEDPALDEPTESVESFPEPTLNAPIFDPAPAGVSSEATEDDRGMGQVTREEFEALKNDVENIRRHVFAGEVA